MFDPLGVIAWPQAWGGGLVEARTGIVRQRRERMVYKPLNR